MKIPPVAFRVVGAVAILGAGWWGYSNYYATPRAEIEQRLNTTRERVGAIQKTLKEEAALKERAKTTAADLLSGKLDELSARFRDGLARVAEQQGLTAITVEAGQPQEELSPLLNTKDVPVSLKRALRKSADFSVVRGMVRGVGSLEQVSAALASIQAQAWIHRVEGFTIKPIGKERAQFELRVDVATIYAPGVLAKAGISQSEPTIATPTPRAQQYARAFSARNIFRKPPVDSAPVSPVVAVAGPGEASSAPVAQPFAPYEDWRLSGLVSGRSGEQVMLENTRTGALLTIQRGGSVLDAVFVEGSGERAVFEIGGRRFEVSTGQSLATRRPLG